MHRWPWYSKQALMLLSTPSPSQTQPGTQSILVSPWEPLTHCGCQPSLSNYKWTPVHEGISLTVYPGLQLVKRQSNQNFTLPLRPLLVVTCISLTTGTFFFSVLFVMFAHLCLYRKQQSLWET